MDTAKVAPAFSAITINGEMISLDQYKGKFVILDFWGTWCMGCINSFPYLKHDFLKYKDHVVMIGVDCSDSPDKWRSAVKLYDLAWTQIQADEQNQLVKKYKIEGYPTIILISPEGKELLNSPGGLVDVFKVIDRLSK